MMSVCPSSWPIVIVAWPANGCAESLAGGGRVHTARGAVEQGGADFPLERGDLLGQRGLRDADGLGGAAEVLVLGQGEGVAQMPQLHPLTISQGYRAGGCQISALPAVRGAVCSGCMAEPIKPTAPGPWELKEEPCPPTM
jgi:hypothetical protein